jgi:SAM-dependent methyltransferase
MDFNSFEPDQKFDLVWASHVLEHQRNVGIFIERLVACCADGGTICITVPDPHRFLWGGHVTLWTPGLLAYNVALCGVDLKDAVFVRGSGEFSLFFQPKRAALPEDLTFDYGDLDKLAPVLPQQWRENGDPWKVSYKRS